MQMATVQTLRDGLFSVTWKVHPSTLRRFSRPSPVTFDLPNYTGRISYKLSMNEALDFDVDLMLVARKAGNDDESSYGGRPILPHVFAGKDGFRQPMIPVPSPVGPYWTSGTAGTYWKTCWPSKVSSAESHDDQLLGGSSGSSRTGSHRSKPAVAFDLLIDFGSSNSRSPHGRHLITDGQKQVLDGMARLLDDLSLADVTFKFPSGELIRAHSTVLVSSSPVLAAMFRHDVKERRNRTVEVSDVEPQVLQQLLQYLYTGTAKEPAKMMTEDVLAAADKYQVDWLKDECSALLAAGLRLDNVVRTLVLAHLHSCHELYQSALDFMAKNALEVVSRADWKELMRSYPDVCFQATRLMVLCGDIRLSLCTCRDPINTTGGCSSK